ncbi:MAG: hypothetical protein WCT10_03865 [Patescibacteria group bacterium]
MRLFRFRDQFRIETAERPWITLFAGNTFILTAANLTLWTLLEAFLIKRAGVEYLPIFFIMSSVAIFIGSWLALGPLRQLRPFTQVSIFFAFAFAGSILLAVGEGFVEKTSEPLAALVFVGVGLVVNSAGVITASVKQGVVTAQAFNLEQMRRFQPLLSSVDTVSSIAAGAILAGLSELLPPAALFLIVSFFLGLGLVFSFRQMKLARKSSLFAALPPEPADDRASGGRGWLARLGDRDLQRFVLIFAILAVLSMLFTRIFSYMFAVAANTRYLTEPELNAFLGRYMVILNVVSLVFINLISHQLFKRVGATGNLLTSPAITFLGSFLLLLTPVFPVVVAVNFLRDIVYPLQGHSMQQIFGGVSDRQRDAILSWLDGPVATVGGLAGSFLLIALGWFVPESEPMFAIRVLSAIAVCLLLIRFAAIMDIRRRYPEILIARLRGSDYATRLRAMESLTECRHLSGGCLAPIISIIQDQAEPVALRVAALRTAAAIQDPSCLRVVGKQFNHPRRALRREAIRTAAAFKYASDRLYESGFSRHTLIARLREAFRQEAVSEIVNDILDALVALRDPNIIPLIIDSLKSGSPELAHSALRSLRLFHDPAVIDFVRPFLASAEPDLRAQAVAALWQFTWERQALSDTIVELLAKPEDAAAYRQGLYLVGHLRLRDQQALLQEALNSASAVIRLAAAIALLKMGDESGASELDAVLATGDRGLAREVERLRDHEGVPAKQRETVAALIHEHHLHYPPSLPVSEPLRVRLCDIPKECLAALLTFYKEAGSTTNLRKIELALENKSFPPTRGRVAVTGLTSPWKEMVAIALLSHGFLIRFADPGAEVADEEIVVAGPEAAHRAARAAVLTRKIGELADHEVSEQHYAPSELLAVVEQIRLAGH